MSMILYKWNASPPARAVHIVAEILGLSIETRELNVLNKEQFTPEYLKKNPMHTVPLLEEGDFVLADSHAIIIYLVSKYGEGKSDVLYPSDLEDRAIIHQRLFFDASILFPRLVDLVKDVVYQINASIDEEKVPGVKEAYGFLEKYLERSTFLAGENITIADISCVTTVSTLNIVVPIDDQYPKTKAWFEVLSNEEWYKKINIPGVTESGVLLASVLQKNAE